MIKNKYGHILAISSAAAATDCGVPFLIAYTSSKSAVISFMSSLSEELRVTGLGDFIKTTCVLPYFINTRQDIMDLLNLRFPAYEPEYVADKSVKGLLYERETVLVTWMGEYSQFFTKYLFYSYITIYDVLCYVYFHYFQNYSQEIKTINHGYCFSNPNIEKAPNFKQKRLAIFYLLCNYNCTLFSPN